MKNTDTRDIGKTTVNYDLVDKEFKRADEIRLPVSIISKMLKKKRRHILNEHLKWKHHQRK